jgi:S-phase kinase-associated protein 1
MDAPLPTHGMIKLQPSDAPDQVYEVPLNVARISKTIANMLEDFPPGAEMHAVPLHNVTSKMLAKVFDFCKHEVDVPPPPAATEDKDKAKAVPAPLSEWVQAFCKVAPAELFEMILVANYLDIEPLLAAACRTVAAQLVGKTPEEIRVAFHIKNDFTPEEEEKIRKENEWCEEH